MPIQCGGWRTRPNNDMAGMEDLQIYIFGGKTLYWELKSDKGKQSPRQKEREQELLALGHKYFLIRNIEQALGSLRAEGLSLLGVR